MEYFFWDVEKIIGGSYDPCEKYYDNRSGGSVYRRWVGPNVIGGGKFGETL